MVGGRRSNVQLGALYSPPARKVRLGETLLTVAQLMISELSEMNGASPDFNLHMAAMLIPHMPVGCGTTFNNLMESTLTSVMDRAGLRTKDDSDKIVGLVFGHSTRYESLKKLIHDLRKDWYTQRGSRQMRETGRRRSSPANQVRNLRRTHR